MSKFIRKWGIGNFGVEEVANQEDAASRAPDPADGRRQNLVRETGSDPADFLMTRGRAWIGGDRFLLFFPC